MTYAYQHAMGSIWNDFDHEIYRDLVFAYPTENGVIDTIAWEGFREAVDDVRYITTLEIQLVRENAKQKKRTELVIEIDNFIQKLKSSDQIVDPDATRQQIIHYILRLTK